MNYAPQAHEQLKDVVNLSLPRAESVRPGAKRA
jgi:hypothetical protein